MDSPFEDNQATGKHVSHDLCFISTRYGHGCQGQYWQGGHQKGNTTKLHPTVKQQFPPG